MVIGKGLFEKALGERRNVATPSSMVEVCGRYIPAVTLGLVVHSGQNIPKGIYDLATHLSGLNDKDLRSELRQRWNLSRKEIRAFVKDSMAYRKD